MKITKQYVAANADGTFIQAYESQTHTGFHINVSSTIDIEQASLFSNPRFPSFEMRKRIVAYQWVPVEVRREVVLLGYGVKQG